MIKWLMHSLIVGGTAACLATDLPAREQFLEEWESSSIQTTRWTKWGSPESVLQTGGNTQGSYSFDPGGDASYRSVVVSAGVLPLRAGLRVSVDTDIETASRWSELEFGLANTTAVTPYNVHLAYLAMVTIDADTQGSAAPAENNF